MRDFIEDLRLIEKIRSKISFPEDDFYESYDEKEILYGETKDPLEHFEEIREKLRETHKLKEILE